MPDGSFKPGVFVFRTLDDCRKIAAYAEGKARAAVIGGGLLGLEAARGLQNFGLEVHVVHRGGHLMGQQLDPQAGAILTLEHGEAGRPRPSEERHHRHPGRRPRAGLAFRRRHPLECDMVVISAGISPNWEIAAGCGLTIERAIVVDDQMRTPRRSAYLRRRRVRAASRAGLWAGRAALGTGQSAGRPHHRPQPERRLSRLQSSDQAEGDGRGSRVHGRRPSREFEEDEIIQFTEPKRGTYKKLIVRDGRLIGAILLGDISKAAYLMQAFDRNTPLPEERLTLLFDIGAPSKQVTFVEMTARCPGV